MNICYVANSRFPSERAHMTQIVQMCNAFTENGHKVTLLVTDRKTHIAEDPEAFFGVPLSFSVVRLKVPDMAGRAKMIPRILHPFTFMLQRCVFSWRAARHIREHGYDLVYGRDEWILWLLSMSVRVPIIWESHEARFSFIVRRLCCHIKKLVVISEGIRDYYIEQGISESEILVAHDAVDSRFFEPHVSTAEARKRLSIEPQRPVVMYIGGLEEWKGAEILFEATKNQDVFETYVIGGKESELEVLRSRYPHVHFLGPRPYRDLPKNQQAADVLVIPNTGKTSLSAAYTSPLKLFTYMTAKKPIVASRIPSITNVLNEDECFFFTPDDSQALHVAICETLNDPESAQKKADKAYEKSLRHTWTNRAREIVQYIST